MNKTNQKLTEKEKIQIKAGYYRKHGQNIRASVLAKLSTQERDFYKNYKKESFLYKAGQGLSTVAFMAALWSSPIWVYYGWNALFGSSSSSSSDSSYSEVDNSDCNPNYSSCLPNSDYDLDCADIGRTVRVIGYDEYNLDGDGDGSGCESY